ncbi:coiled-coil domain-containing protein [Histomonas meleagridis]|uniref:coiled-coil domain-containing protein n=1 Tax=Histomonas meleagridis TaxID=135588 RepID=UPI0035594895|nr:coiled-coil domain-containing protein [Histomonas meleagridis]KAH0806902.1 coiled-coil domain-containing protein [Histomonas meleagridis]
MEEKQTFPHQHLFPNITEEQKQTLIDYIPDVFYENDKDFDPIDFSLSLLPDADNPDFNKELDKLSNGQMDSLDIVSRNLNQNVLENYTEVIRAMTLISDLNNHLNVSAQNISQARQILSNTDREICEHPDKFFRQVTKQQNLDKVLGLLNEIQTISKGYEDLSEAHKNHDYVTALELCSKPSDLNSNIRQLNCISGLVSNLQNMKEKVVSIMDDSLREQIVRFERDVYRNLLRAYESLGKLQVVPIKLQEAFVTKLTTENDSLVNNNADFKTLARYKQLLQRVIDNNYSILNTHLQIINWHRSTNEFESIRKPIEDIAKILWDSAENYVTNIIIKAPADKLGFEEFDRMLKLTSSFIQFGSTVVDLPGQQLTNAVNNLTNKYFKLFQKSALETAHENIENDTWNSIPSTNELERSILTLSIPIKESNDSNDVANITIPSAFPIDLQKMTISCSAIIKLLHQYLSMMKLVPTLATDCFKGMKELIEYYSFSLLYIVTKNLNLKPFDINNNQINIFNHNLILMKIEESQCLIRIIQHIQESQIKLPLNLTNSINNFDNNIKFINDIVSISSDIKIIGWYLLSIRTIFEESLPENSLGQLRRFFNDVVNIFLMHFPSFCFQYITPNLVHLGEFEQQVKLVKWNINEAQVEPHYFTNVWKEAAKNINVIINKLESIDQEYKDELWKGFWCYSNFILINGYSVQKCTAEGRTSMLSDFRNMSHDLIEFTNKRIQFDTNWVASFVQSFFLGVPEFKKWASENYKRYTCNNIMAVVETGLSDDINRQAKKELRLFVQELYNS